MMRSLLTFTVLFSWLTWVSASKAPSVVTPTEFKIAKEKHGEFAFLRLKSWQALVDDNINRPERLKLSIVNNFFNQVRFIDDIDHWKKEDYWASPFELLVTDGGDCEDFVIAKYFTLIALGVPESRLLLTYVKSLRLNQAHMVLTYFKTPQSVPLVLDNLTDRILKATARTDLVPIYSFNGKGLWLSKQRGKGKGKAVQAGTSQLKEWNRLLKKMNP